MLVKDYGPHSPFLAQLAVAVAKDRRLTGVGVFVDFLITGEAPSVDEVNTEISSDYRTRLDPPCDLVGFTLFIRNGYLSFLEGYTFGDTKWPAEPMDDWLLPDQDQHGSGCKRLK